MDGFTAACSLIPDSLKAGLDKMNKAEELRFRIGHRPTALICGKEYHFSLEKTNSELILRILEKATGASMHSFSATMKNGYIDYKGLRIGVCGQAIFSEGQMIGYSSYSSLAIRIPHEHKGICSELISRIVHDMPDNCLIIGQPGSGKTTVLRELIRCCSDHGYRTAAADERNELAAVHKGLPQYDIGKCTDIITGMPKADASMILLRTMNPQIIAMDEISHSADVDAVYNIAGCGVSVFATVHGRDIEDMRKRKIYRGLLDAGIFNELITIRCENDKREYTAERISGK